MSVEKQSWRLLVDSLAGVSLGRQVELSEDEHHYALHVLRLEAGVTVELGDGCGGVADATLVRCDKKSAVAEVTNIRRERRFASRITLILAQPKPSTLEEVVTLASEMGVARVVVFRGERTHGKQHIKVEKLERLAKEALRVTKGFRAPEIALVETAESTSSECARAGALFLCDEGPLYAEARSDERLNDLRSALDSAVQAGARDVGLIVGPEASLSSEERARFRALGALPVSLGPLVLRVPTAVAYAAGVALSTLNPDWERESVRT
jgi:16S rRNA (uracil1498-N3)-methyltransferase